MGYLIKPIHMREETKAKMREQAINKALALAKVRNFHYSVNLLSQEAQSSWNMDHTIQERRDQKNKLMNDALQLIPKDERLKWLLVEHTGIMGNSIHDVYIAFELTWLITPKGRRRRVNLALRMAGVPFIKVNRTPEGWEISPNGIETINIAAMKDQVFR